MVALITGTKAPLFRLKALAPEHFSLAQGLKASPGVVLAFFKVTCPTCQLTLPYLERIHRSYPDVPIWGISQDDTDPTSAFARMYGCSFTMLLDDNLETTQTYGLTTVPTIFLVLPDGLISKSIVGFVKADLEDLNNTIASISTRPHKALFTRADEVPAVMPGCMSKQST